MKRIVLISLITIIPHLLRSADECCTMPNNRGALLVKQGFFLPQDQALRNIFHCAGSRAGYFVEGDYRFNFFCGLKLEISASYLQRKGRALVCQWPGSCDTPAVNGYDQWLCTGYTSCCGDCIKFKMPTIGVGLKYFFEVRKHVEFFLGGGFKMFFVRIENDSPFVVRHDKKNEPGAVVNVGVSFNPYKCFIVELFADYLIGNIKNCSPACCSMNCDLNIGGFVGGITLGCRY